MTLTVCSTAGSAGRYMINKGNGWLSTCCYQCAEPNTSSEWSGWNIQSVNSASVAKGALGKELFTYGKESGYWIIPFGMFIGLFCPIPFWVIHRYSKPGSTLAKTMKYINVPIITLYIGYLPYSVNGQWRSCFVIGFFSQW
ncbi:hypothetical protein ARMGADRAFT_1034741 [Armillaria gallica]|uniref:Uncharacterized protein n=1 Tax=Armillaria gallica TaxID=47427 RepID=A0A2H3D0C4_ARMGA|nr:hypothetical protein ARMGADRAFT_1034741 [Armillaria gallica]